MCPWLEVTNFAWHRP